MTARSAGALRVSASGNLAAAGMRLNPHVHRKGVRAGHGGPGRGRLACSLAACGSAASGTGASGLCGQASQVTHLAVERVDGILRNRQHFSSPAKVTVSDPAKARSVAVAACAPPRCRQAPLPALTTPGWRTG
jgi:hypothetical protein